MCGPIQVTGDGDYRYFTRVSVVVKRVATLQGLASASDLVLTATFIWFWLGVE